LGEVVGMESKGLAADTTIASLPSVTYQAQDKQDGNMEQYEHHFVMLCP
jgi:E3 ubiquitin-protein ligase BIG BROTHER-like protein